MSRRAVVAVLALLPACVPDLAVRASLVTGTRVLAVRGEPPEAPPGMAVTYTLLVASVDGEVSSPPASWAYCATPKLLTENGTVSPACLGDAGRPVASGPAIVTAPVPADACALFGPEVSSAELRPRDPDVTGGFYQPIRVVVAGAETMAIGLERIRCNAAGTGAELATELDRRYVANENPALLPLEASVDGHAVSLDAVPRGARVTFRASWPAEDAERYVVLDPTTQQLVERREWMRVSWFATGGSFANDHTGRTEAESESSTDNEWTAPDAPTTTHVFVVLHDARGGVAFATYAIRTH